MNGPFAHLLIITSISCSIYGPIKHKVTCLLGEVCDQLTAENKSLSNRNQGKTFTMHCSVDRYCACGSHSAKSEAYQPLILKLSESLHKWNQDSIYMRKWEDLLSLLHCCLWANTFTNTHAYSLYTKTPTEKPPNEVTILRWGAMCRQLNRF